MNLPGSSSKLSKVNSVLLAFWILRLAPLPVGADETGMLFHDRREMTVGIIQSVFKNTITIEDERNHEVRSLIRPGIEREFQKGDYVRVYYHTHGNLIDTIKRMTVLGYKKEKQNLGYIFKKQE